METYENVFKYFLDTNNVLNIQLCKNKKWLFINYKL